MNDPSWLVPGADAVILQPSDRASLQAEAVTIDRVLKRDVVLSNGSRFRIDTLSNQVGGTWGYHVHLVPPTDPRVEPTRTAIRYKNLRSRAIRAFDDWSKPHRQSAEAGVSASDVAAVFTKLAAFEAEMGGGR